MYAGIYSAASSIDAIERAHEVVANNLANINTPGFRAQTTSFQSLVADHQSINGTRRHGTDMAQPRFDFQSGVLESTGRELDLALEGDGFFELSSESGPLYTRNGVFFIGEDGALVNASGLPVEGESGPIQFAPGVTPDQVTIGPDGSIQVGGANIGKVKVVNFEDPHQLHAQGTVLFDGRDAVPTESTALVQQGVRELSNVNATQQLVKLISGMRHHEAAQKALRSMSDTIAQRLRPN
jgi:flagellar basal-body rod protein FlgF